MKMSKYYLDIETTGLNPNENKIISIQTAFIDEKNKKFRNIKVYMHDDEAIILENFFRDYREIINKYGVFGYIFVGYNIQFDLVFLWKKARVHGIEIPFTSFESFIFKVPFLDLRHLVILMNDANFKGSSLSNFSKKKHDGNIIIDYLHEKNKDKIMRYIYDETEAYKNLYFFLRDKMNKLKKVLDVELLQNDFQE